MNFFLLRKLIKQSLLIISSLIVVNVAYASTTGVARKSWEPIVSSHKATPPGFVAVDKKRQQLFFLERSYPLKVIKSYLCSTGQVAGDKLTEGDLRTPEGIYFVVQHVRSGLDYDLYGKEAYTLNYPNPVDRLHKKTGYGIWIHGRGPGIAPLQTQGCVALNNRDLDVLGKFLKPGTPVLLSSNFVQTPYLKAQDIQVKKLESLVQSWATSWRSKSSSLFDYYNPTAYSITTEPFSHFKSNKEKLFKSLPWIKTNIQNIQILQGPDYWVTWFQQNYEAPNLSTKGVRRLYWQEDARKGFKIVGMEWIPGQTTDVLLAMDDQTTPLAGQIPKTEPQAPEITIPDLRGDSAGNKICQEEDVEQKSLLSKDQENKGTEIIIAHNSQESKDLITPTPEATPEPKPAITPTPEATPEPKSVITLTPEATPTPKSVITPTPEATPTPKSVAIEKQKLPTPSITTVSNKDKDKVAELKKLVSSWSKAWQNRSISMLDYYNKEAYSKNTENFKSFAGTKKRLFKNLPWIKTSVKNIIVRKKKDIWITSFYQTYAASNLTSKGIRRLYWTLDANNAFKIIRMEWLQGKTSDPVVQSIQDSIGVATKQATTSGNQNIAKNGGSALSEKGTTNSQMQTVAVNQSKNKASDTEVSPPVKEKGKSEEPLALKNTLEDKLIEASNLVEAWKKAWEQGNISQYVNYYANGATQGTRKGKKNIRRQKQKLWKQKKPMSISLRNIKVSAHKDAIYVEFTQLYKDNSGHEDKGIKNLTIELVDGKLLITNEQWRGLR